MKTEGSTKSCIPELKKCSDHTSDDDCISLQAGDGQRCLLLEGGKCEAHYNDCTQLTSQGEAKCVANIPNDNSNMFIMGFFLILAVISSVQEFVCGESFADYKVFVLAFLVGNIGHYLTKYYYYKEKKLLGYSILFATLSICTLIGIIVKA